MRKKIESSAAFVREGVKERLLNTQSEAGLKQSPLADAKCEFRGAFFFCDTVSVSFSVFVFFSNLVPPSFRTPGQVLSLAREPACFSVSKSRRSSATPKSLGRRPSALGLGLTLGLASKRHRQQQQRRHLSQCGRQRCPLWLVVVGG